MLRKLALLLIPLAVLAAACGGNSKDNSPSDTTLKATATAAAGATGEPTSAPTSVRTNPTPIVIATPDLGSSPIDLGGGDHNGANSTDLINAINPLGLLSGIDHATATDGVSPQLAAQLLSASDLPSGFMSMGDYSMSIPTGAGTMDMSMNMFASGDIASTGEMGTMVMSAAILLSPEARAEIGQESLDALENLSDADLEAIRAGSAGLGFAITDLHLLDASGLGEGGAGIHMAMDFSGMMDAFGGMPEGESPLAGGIAMDMYMFFEGDYMHMVMVMYPTGSSSGVDARALADVLDSRTASTPL
jgi:hypothetical protein